MLKSIEQMIAEQLGGLTLELIKRDTQIEQLLDENAKLKEALKLLEKKEEK